MSESNSNVIPAINAVDGFNPADFVRTTVGEEGENDLYLDVKYRLLWFRLHHPNGKIDPELIRVDEKNAIVCCRIYADKADPADQFIGKAYSQRFSTEDRFGDRFLEIAETVAKGQRITIHTELRTIPRISQSAALCDCFGDLKEAIAKAVFR